jgi:hypothetical protein
MFVAETGEAGEKYPSTYVAVNDRSIRRLTSSTGQARHSFIYEDIKESDIFNNHQLNPAYGVIPETFVCYTICCLASLQLRLLHSALYNNSSHHLDVIPSC